MLAQKQPLIQRVRNSSLVERLCAENLTEMCIRDSLKTKSFQNRTVGLMENGTWAPMAAKLMRAELESMKNITVCENVVTIRSAANAAAEAQMDALAAEIVAK